MDAVARSQLVRVQRLALTATVCVQNIPNQALQFFGMSGRRIGPSLVFIQLVKEQSSKGILPVLRRFLQPFDGLLKSFGHMLNCNTRVS
jgi:hypothetical protein